MGAQKPAPKPHPEVQKLIDAATGDKVNLKNQLLQLERALLRAKQLDDAFGTGQVLLWLGDALRALGEHRKALNCFEQALPLWRKVGDLGGEAATLHNIGFVWDARGERRKAVEFYEQALPLWRKVGDLGGEATTLHNIGFVCQVLGDIRKALGSYEQALRLYRKVEEMDGEATTLNNIGSAWGAIGEKRKALDNYERALTVRRKMVDIGGEAAILSNIGAIWADLGDKRKALEFHELALTLSRKAENILVEATALNHIGGVWDALGEKRKALEYLEQALPLRRKAGDIGGESDTLNNIGVVWDDLGEKRKAMEYYELALTLSRKAEHIFGEATILNNIGFMWSRLGEKRKALEFYEQALSLFRKADNLSGEATTLNNIGGIQRDLGENRRALEFYDQALVLIRESRDLAHEATALDNVANIWAQQGDRGVSLAFGKLSVNLHQTLRQGASGLGSQTEIAFLQSMRIAYVRLGNALQAQGRIAEAMQAQELQEASKIKEFVYRGTPEQDMFQKRLTLTRLEKLWLNKYEEAAEPLGELGKQREELARIKERLPEQEKKLKEIDAKVKEAETNFQKTIGDMTEAFKKANPEDNKLEDLAKDRDLTLIAKTLTEKTNKQVGVIATMVGEKSFHVMLLKPDATVVTKEIPVTRADLSNSVTEALLDLNSPNRQPFGSLGKLYDMVVKPFEGDMKGLDCLMFNLNGPLRYVPMAALYDGKSYLAEKYQVTNFSIAVWERLADEAPKSWSPTFFGLTKKVEGFDELPGVKAETEAAAPLFQTTPQLDDAFTQPILEKLLKEKKSNLLHFGTHFALDPASSDETYMLLGDGTKWKPTEMEEKKDLSFEGVEMLVASACKTGVPTGDDASIEGFGAYCQVKGAKSVLSTLWEVNDEATGQWMKTFYNLLSQGTGKGEAFHRAQLAMITGEDAKALSLPKAGTRANPSIPSQTGEPDKPFVADPKRPLAHPYYWAPFTLSGNWR